MAIPLGLFTVAPVVAEFMPPLDEDYTPLVEAVLGGTALGSGAAGRQVQRWTIAYESGHILVADSLGVIVSNRAIADVMTVSLAFDSNMQLAYSYITSTGAHLFYFDSVAGAFATLDIPGADSCRSTVDDPRQLTSAGSDALFIYTLADKLYYRAQRERYAVEHLIGTANGMQVLRAGPNSLNRLQIKLGVYVPPDF